MNHIKKIPSLILISSVTLLALTSCGEDPVMVEKREKQRAEIARLSGELALIEEKLKHLPPDVSEEVRKATEETEKQKDNIAQLEKEIAELEAKKRALQSDFDSYRAKYQLK